MVNEKRISKKEKNILFSIINKEKNQKNNKSTFDKNNKIDNKKHDFDISKINNNTKENLISDNNDINNNSSINKYLNVENNSCIDNDNETYDNSSVNKEYSQERIKTIIKNNQSYKLNKNQKPKKRNNDFSFNTNNKTINNCYSNRYQNILTLYDNFDMEDFKNDNYSNKNVRTINSNNNLLLVTNVTKCPQCHCLFGKPSKLLNNNDNEE